MSEWLTDPKYGGMSETAARCSHEAWVRNGRKPARIVPEPSVSDEELRLIKLGIDIQLREYEAAITAAVAWCRGWKSRQPAKGFRRAKRREMDPHEAPDA